MTYTAASQQGAVEMSWLHYGELSGCPSFTQSESTAWFQLNSVHGAEGRLPHKRTVSHFKCIWKLLSTFF